MAQRPQAPVTIDHLSFGTRDLIATHQFDAMQLGFPVLIHEWMLMEEGGRVDHMFFDCGAATPLRSCSGLMCPVYQVNLMPGSTAD
jgi:hypothetical protein